MASSTRGERPLFPFDVFSEIFKYCDRETLHACSIFSKDMHESTLPFLFENISFRANRPPLPSILIQDIPQGVRDQFCSGPFQRFTELPTMRVAAFVRQLIYEGCRLPDIDARQYYHRTVWSVFRATLSATAYTGLTELILTSVDIDAQDAQGISTLEKLRLLYLVNAQLSEGVVFGGRLRPKALHFSPPRKFINTSANAILNVCENVKFLQLYRLPSAPHILYRILEHTPLLRELHITLDKPVLNDPQVAPALDGTLCRLLSAYVGPYYYSMIIDERPVQWIDVHDFPVGLSYEMPRA